MKTIRRILVTAMISLSFSAANAFSELNLRLFDNSNFNVTIDNAYYGNSSSFCLPGLMPGSHYLVVTKPDYNCRPYGHGHGHGQGHGYGHEKNGTMEP